MHPFVSGLSFDLLFFISIKVFFFSQSKGLYDWQILLLPSISAGVFLLLQIPAIFIIRKIGNLHSFRLSLFLSMLAALLFILADGFVFLAIAYCVYAVAFQYRTANLLLHDNLKAEGKEHLFGKQISRAALTYSLATMVIFLIAGVLFDLHHYVPMYLCLAFTVLCFVLSFFMRVEQPQTTQATETANAEIKVPKQNHAAKISIGLLIIFLLCYMVGRIIINGGEGNVAMLYKNVGLTATVATILIFVGRLSRVISNLSYTRLKKRLGKYFLLLLPVLWILAFSIMGLSFFFVTNFYLMIALITLGVIFLFFTRDPLQHEIQQFIVDNYQGKTRITIKSLQSVASYSAALVIGIIKSLIIYHYTVGHVVLLFAALAVPALILNVILCVHLSRRATSELQDKQATTQNP